MEQINYEEKFQTLCVENMIKCKFVDDYDEGFDFLQKNYDWFPVSVIFEDACQNGDFNLVIYVIKMLIKEVAKTQNFEKFLITIKNGLYPINEELHLQILNFVMSEDFAIILPKNYTHSTLVSFRRELLASGLLSACTFNKVNVAKFTTNQKTYSHSRYFHNDVVQGIDIASTEDYNEIVEFLEEFIKN